MPIRMNGQLTARFAGTPAKVRASDTPNQRAKRAMTIAMVMKPLMMLFMLFLLVTYINIGKSRRNVNIFRKTFFFGGAAR